MAATLLAAFLASCGGGSSSSGNAASSGSSGSGQVALFLRDGPVEYDSVFVTIHEITLRGDGDHDSVVLFTSGAGLEVDLLDLRDEDLLMTIADFVPAGVYDRIDLEVSNVYTVGGPCDSLEVRVPSGKLKLKSKEPFGIAAGELTSIRLDVDAKKSLHLHPAGSSGHCNFRPVVFIEVQSGAFDDRCHRNVTGPVFDIVTDGAGTVSGLQVELSEGRGDLHIGLTADTAFFGSDGLPVDTLSINAGEVYTFHGGLTDDGVFQAAVVVDGTVLEIAGSTTTLTVDGFELDPAADSAIVGVTPVATFDSTAFFFDCTPFDTSPVQLASDVRVTGKLSLAAAELRAAVVHVDPPKLEGSVTAITEVADGHLLTIDPANGSAAVDVFVADSTPFELDAGGELAKTLVSDLVACAPRDVVVTFDAPGTTAVSVELVADQIEGEVDAIDSVTGEWSIDGDLVEVLPGALVISLIDGSGSATISDVAIGSTVRLFGLAGCSTPLGFHASVVLIIAD